MDFIKLEAWRKITLELAAAKELEMTLRKELFSSTFAQPEEGVNKHEIAQGWQLKATVPYTRTLDQPRAEAVFKVLKKEKRTDLFKVKYELNVTEYKKLADDDMSKTIIDAILTTKPGTPSMELVAPKVG